jgi:hypothetical protein
MLDRWFLLPVVQLYQQRQNKNSSMLLDKFSLSVILVVNVISCFHQSTAAY